MRASNLNNRNGRAVFIRKYTGFPRQMRDEFIDTVLGNIRSLNGTVRPQAGATIASL